MSARPIRRQIDEDEAVILEEAGRCRELFVAIIDRARKDAAGRSESSKRIVQPHVQEEAREFLEWLGAAP
jgi:hypothetical protein